MNDSLEWYPLETLSPAEVSARKEGRCYAVRVRRRKLGIVFANGDWFAFDAKCPHAGGPLTSGKVEDETVICPWHKLTFSVRDGKCENGGYFIETYPVREEKYKLWVGFSRRAWWKIF